MAGIDELDDCPKCGYSWVGDKIPEDSKHLFGDSENFKKVIGVEYTFGPNSYDGISEWKCPKCSTRWGRWTGKELAADEEEPVYGKPTNR